MAVPIGMGSGLEKIKEIVLKGNFIEEKKKGLVVEKNVLEEYKKHVLSFINLENFRSERKLKIVVDAGNSIAGKIVPLIYDELPIDLIKMYFEITGKFEHHEANPLKEENTKDLREKVVKEKTDLGIAFDGDMDRVFFIDELGNQIESSAIAVLLIKYFYKYMKNNGFVYSATMSRYIPELAELLNLPSYKEKVGHAFIKQRMKKENAFFGCEDSGHFYYKKNWFADSGIITSLLVLEILSRESEKGKRFSDLCKDNKYVKLKESNFKIKDKKSAYEKIIAHFKKLNPKKIEKLDGLSFYFYDYWFNIRFSQTEPVLRLNLEADNEVIMKEKSEEISRFLEQL